MRSFLQFNLILAMCTLMSVQTAAFAAESPLSKSGFFKVVFDFDEPEERVPSSNISSPKTKDHNLKQFSELKKARLQAVILKGMKTLLVRLTGQKRFLYSAAGKGYLKNPSAWLTSYDIQPRMEEGVQVGQQIVLTFSESKMRAEFSQRFVKIWPLKDRPTTLVMGTIVQNGELLKLDEERMQYRVDVDYRAFPRQIALPITVPNTTRQWVLPAMSRQTPSLIQETLARVDHDYLLSFKLVIKSSQHTLLLWNLFADSGALVSKGLIQGKHQQALIQQMFDQILFKYVQRANQEVRKVNQIRLNLFQVTNLQQALAFETLLKQNQRLIRSAHIVGVQSGMLALDLYYEGDYSKVLQWIRTLPNIDYLYDSLENQRIDVKLQPNFDQIFDDKTALKGHALFDPKHSPLTEGAQ